MSVSSQMMQQLEQWVSRGGGQRSATFTLRDPRGRLEIDFAEVDALACAFRFLSWTTSRPRPATGDQVRQVGERLARQLDYLLEPIHLLEVDPVAPAAQLRSDPPDRAADRRSYYELLVRPGGDVHLCRYEKRSGQPRQPVPAIVTRQVLQRLVRDVTECTD